MWRLYLVLIFGLVGCSVRAPQAIDYSQPAAESRDYTIVFEGCGQGPTVGYLFCRVTEGSLATQKITIYFPSVDCRRESCIDWQFIQPSSDFGAFGALPARSNRVELTLKEIIQTAETVDESHDDEYLLASRIWYLNGQDEEFSVKAYGIVRLRVLKKLYTQLACNDPELAWIEKISGGCEAHFSTTMRAAVCCGAK